MSDEVAVAARADDRTGGRGGSTGATWRVAVPVFVVAAVCLWLARRRRLDGQAPLGWNDTTDFLASAQAPWLSLELWAGKRPAGTPALLKLLGDDIDAYISWQSSCAVLAWSLLAASVATAIGGRWARWVAALAVVAFSVTTPVTMWEPSVLSESLAISSLALVVAAGVQVARAITGPRVAMLIAALALWVAIRDSHASVAVVGGAAALAGAVVPWASHRWRRRSTDASADVVSDAGLADDGRSDDGFGDDDADTRGRGLGVSPVYAWPRWSRPLVVLGAAALVLGLAVGWASSHGERHAFPMRNVYEVRVLPYADRVTWFADHGMPQADVFTGPARRLPYVEPGIPPVVYVGDDDPELGPWLDWVETDGRAAFVRFVLTHPTYLVTEPLHTPERTFNNALGDRSFYAPPDWEAIPVADPVLVRPTGVVLAIGAATAAVAFVRRRWPPMLIAGAATALLAMPHGMLAWHSDGMETARHLVVPALQLHLGVLLMLIGTVAGPPADPGPSSGGGIGGRLPWVRSRHA